jgi:hypothetical protein
MLYTIASTVAITLVVMLCSTTSFAQSIELRAEIPFDFYVSSKLMPAGTYYIASVGYNGAVRIWDKEGTSAVTLTNAASNRDPGTSRMVFHRIGSEFFLSELYWEGYDLGKSVQPSKRELEAANHKEPVTVQIAVSPKK